MILVDGQSTEGVELGIAGRITESWRVMGGYAYQDGEITTTQSATAVAGNRLAQLPRHSASLWNRYDVNASFGVGLGIIHRGAIYANVDNLVTCPFTCFDGAVYWTLNPSVQLQLNIENLGNKRYFASAHSNNNSARAPRARVADHERPLLIRSPPCTTHANAAPPQRPIAGSASSTCGWAPGALPRSSTASPAW